MKYIKKVNEFFYFDGGPYYGGAKDPSIPKPSQLASKEYVYSEFQDKYYTLDDLEDLQNRYFEKTQKTIKINDTATLDSIIKLIYN